MDPTQYRIRVEQRSANSNIIAVDVDVGPMESKGKAIYPELDAKLPRAFKEQRVDVVVVVHDFPRQAVDCIRSIQRYTLNAVNWKLTVVDNACEPFTRKEIKKLKPDRVLRMKKFGGYLPAYHAAIKETDGDWIVFVNQASMVSFRWLDFMMYATLRDPKIAMVAPWSNKQIPFPAGSNFVDVGSRIAATVDKESGPIAFPSGDCVALRRKAVEEVGGFDVDYYAPGYGEFADLFMRLWAKGWKAVRAGYIFAGSKELSNSQWIDVNGSGNQRFLSRWKGHATKALDAHVEMDNTVQVASNMLATKPIGKKVVFVFPDLELCGLTLSAVHICNQLIERGWDASIAYARIATGHSLRHFPVKFEPFSMGSKSALISGLRSHLKDAVIIATTWLTAEYVAKICHERKDLFPVYYIQDDERRFVRPSGRPLSNKEDIEKSYGLIKRHVYNSQWVQAMLRDLGHGGPRIGIGVDSLLFHPGDKPMDRVRVMAHCRMTTPRRGWPFIQSVVNHAAKFCDFEFVTFDQEPDREDLAVPWHGSIGRVSPHTLATHMRASHIFFEGSVFQGWGMQALEAMSCGCALLCTKNKGIDSFGTDKHDCILVGHGDVEGALKRLVKLVKDMKLRNKLGENARKTAEQFDWSIIVGAWDTYLKNVMGKHHIPG